MYCAGALVTTQTLNITAAKQLWVVGTLQFPGNPGACTFTPAPLVPLSSPQPNPIPAVAL